MERTYPPRELITQWRETDLQFIRRILSEVGIYWRTEMDDVRGLDTYIFADSQLNYQSGLSQAGRHQAVATVNHPLKIVWIFMQPVSYRYFSKMFKDFKDIITRWVP
ncbi:phage late control D family protein [Citrobacter sedlakii]|nr:phage late control D family protein [Citrobacter sedlakii]MEB0952925.1 phage late control D family protein [Citrobacter sedlakii]